MPFNTLSVATAVTPSVIETYFSHYLNRGPLRQKPTAHISYHEGLRLIRQFLDYSSKHVVEDLQAFTAQWVPTPTWARIQDSEIAPQFLERAAKALQAQLGWRGMEKIGGKTWWQWRRPEQPLRAEWIEMKKDYNDRKRTGKKCERVILYVHGGAYYFGSVDEHRYQMQRHARKLNARVLAPRYRLAPQFPFPCGLYDCIATYLYLLEHFSPEQILFAGDSAGGGMVLSMLVTLRDQGFPLPAGTILLSPWVDLTHSFPSVAGDGVGDYIPPHGFHHKPSMAWPPPPSNEIKKPVKVFDRPTDAVELPAMEDDGTRKPTGSSAVPGFGDNLHIMLDGKMIQMNEQIQLYTPNDLLAHPLVSPVMQASLGGLPPMLILVGGAELLRDEQIYIAHKAANPKAFPPSEAILNEYDPRREMVNKYPPTDVQLQVWEDLCHVPTTLSFTRPAKYMYRSVAQFGAWALANAQHRGVSIQNDDDMSIISSGPEDGEDANGTSPDLQRKKTRTHGRAGSDAGGLGTKPDQASTGAVGRGGDPLPPFKDHMIRQRVTRHGLIYPLAPQAEIACLALDPATIGTIKSGPVRKWLAKKRENDVKFGNEKKKVTKKRAKELASGYDTIPGECPPPTALVGRRRKGVAPEEKKKSKSWGLAMWSGWGSHHDETTIEREERSDAAARQMAPPLTARSTSNLTVPGEMSGADVKKTRRTSSASLFSPPWSQKERPKSPNPYRQVTDTGQIGVGDVSPQVGSTGSRTLYSRRSSATTSMLTSRPVSVVSPTTGALLPDSVLVSGSQNTYLDPSNNRPHNGIMSYPFKLRNPQVSNPSITTIDSRAVSAMSNSDPNLGPVEMPTPADELVRPTPLNDPAEPMSAISTASSSRAADVMRGVPRSRTRSISPASSPVVGTPRSPLLGSHDRVFENRSSVLGPIGADGMPTAPLIPRQNTDNRLSDPTTALAELEAPRMPAAGDSAPVSPVDNGRSSPFRIRNPVFDSRAPSPASGQLPPPPPPPKNGETETPKATPFKMRHTVVDPNLTPARASTPETTRSVASTPSPQQPASVKHAEEVASRVMTSPVERPRTSELPPNSNVVMPTVVARRPFAVTSNLPPPPPPKDERHREMKGSGLDSKASLPRLRTNDAPVLNGYALGVNGDRVPEKGGIEKRAELDGFSTAKERSLESVNV